MLTHLLKVQCFVAMVKAVFSSAVPVYSATPWLCPGCLHGFYQVIWEAFFTSHSCCDLVVPRMAKAPVQLSFIGSLIRLQLSIMSSLKGQDSSTPVTLQTAFWVGLLSCSSIY